MKYAIISDIHGNFHALEAVFNDIDQNHSERIICLGDLVGYGAFPNEVVDLTRERAHAVIAGNHDHAAVGLTDITAFNRYAYQAAMWTRKTLTDENTKYLKQLPYTHLENDLYFVHASPLHPEQWFYVFSDIDAEMAMKESPTATAFIGHTHVPNDHRTKRGRLINVGSVGQPRDGKPDAAYTLFDADTGQRTLRRVKYDVSAAGTAIRDAGLPSFLAERIELGR